MGYLPTQKDYKWFVPSLNKQFVTKDVTLAYFFEKLSQGENYGTSYEKYFQQQEIKFIEFLDYHQLEDSRVKDSYGCQIRIVSVQTSMGQMWIKANTIARFI